MDKSEGKSNKSNAPRDIKLSLLTAAISATLRIAIPTLSLFFIGLAIDAVRGGTAFWAIVGTYLGFAIAIVLLYFQIKDLAKYDSKNSAKKISQKSVTKGRGNSSRKSDPETRS